MGMRKSAIWFQAELSGKDAAILELLRSQLDIRSNAELLTEALTILSWFVRETQQGHVVASLDRENEGRIRELASPLLERVAPRYGMLPHVNIHWTPEELANLAKLASSDPAEPKKELVAAMSRRW
jgi:hypothetical protein